MKKIFYLFRYISWIAVICSLLGAFLLFIVGAIKTYYAFIVVVFGKIPKESLSHLDSSDIATTYLIQSLDTFLIALILFIFAHGIFTLFISDKNPKESSEVLKWINTPNIGRLKSVLAEVIVIILFVKFLEVVLVNLENLTWELLALPIGILLLSLSLKFLGLGIENDTTK